MKIGELCAGYGGLGMGVKAVLGGDIAWVSDIDPGANKILAHRFPGGVPNIGDMTTVDWAQVEPVDVLTGGTPCQDLSHAGKRAGMTEGTRSNLWVAMREAIAQLRPSLVVWENVRGAYSAAADSEMGWCDRCLVRHQGGGKTLPALRALARVLGDLTDLGYDARWHGLRAADVGAPHGRFRVFVVAYPRGAGWQEFGAIPGSAQLAAVGGSGAPLLPTPAVNDMGEGKTPEVWDEWTAKMQATHGNGNGHGKSLAIEAQRLLPTPTTQDAANNGGPSQRERNTIPLNAVQDWGIYADAIARWEALTRPAPAPTQPSKKGTPQLSPRFSEWMMGLPEGWVTDVPGASRNEALKAIGNGVCPQQCAAALRFLLGAQAVAA